MSDAAELPVEEHVPQSLRAAGALPRDDWVIRLSMTGRVREEAVARLHDLMLRAARHQVGRMPEGIRLGAARREEVVHSAADEATVSVISRLSTFEGRSRFTTWAYKFALLEASVKLRKRAWQGREIPLEPEAWDIVASSGIEPAEAAEQSELLRAVQQAIETALTVHQRRVLVALALNGAPIDVLAERLGTTRGALYKTLHDARRNLRARLTDEGFDMDALLEEKRQ